MPRRYKKRNYRKKSRSTNYLSTASKALTVAYAVKRLINVEFKQLNIIGASAAVTDAGTFTPLTNLVQGDTNITRDGSSVKFTSYRLSYSLQISTSAVNTLVRVLIVHDKQTNQAAFTLGDLLTTSGSVNNIISPYNINNASRFNMLYDRVHTLTTGGNNAVIQRTIHKKLNLKTRFDANVGDITDLTSDSLMMIMISDQTTNDPLAIFAYRSRFVDN